MRRAVFLDRDGTVNVEKQYLYRPEDWEWLPGAVDVIKAFNKLGLLVIVVTNQSGIARGLYTHDEVRILHNHVNTLLTAAGARIDAYYYCPHHPDYGEIRDCQCRKPRTGLILEAQRDFNIDLKNSFIIGDKCSDISAGHAVGATAILVATGYGKNEFCKLKDKRIMTAQDLYEAYKIIEAQLCNGIL